MHIQFYKVDNNGDTQQAGIAFIGNDGEVGFSGLPKTTEFELKEYGILIDGDVLYPKDGEKFLKVLPIQYSGSRFRAELIKD